MKKLIPFMLGTLIFTTVVSCRREDNIFDRITGRNGSIEIPLIKENLGENLKELSKNCWYLRIEKSSNNEKWVIIAKTDKKSYYERNIDLFQAVVLVVEDVREGE